MTAVVVTPTAFLAPTALPGQSLWRPALPARPAASVHANANDAAPAAYANGMTAAAEEEEEPGTEEQRRRSACPKSGRQAHWCSRCVQTELCFTQGAVPLDPDDVAIRDGQTIPSPSMSELPIILPRISNTL